MKKKQGERKGEISRGVIHKGGARSSCRLYRENVMECPQEKGKPMIRQATSLRRVKVIWKRHQGVGWLKCRARKSTGKTEV